MFTLQPGICVVPGPGWSVGQTNEDGKGSLPARLKVLQHHKAITVESRTEVKELKH